MAIAGFIIEISNVLSMSFETLGGSGTCPRLTAGTRGVIRIYSDKTGGGIHERAVSRGTRDRLYLEQVSGLQEKSRGTVGQRESRGKTDQSLSSDAAKLAEEPERPRDREDRPHLSRAYPHSSPRSKVMHRETRAAKTARRRRSGHLPKRHGGHTDDRFKGFTAMNSFFYFLDPLL